MKRPVFFLHIPKTGGTTTRVVLSNQYRFKNHLDFDNFETSKQYDYVNSQKAGIKVVKGHAHLQTVQKEFSHTTISILREPRERLISHYLYARAHNLYPGINKMTLKEVLQQGIIQNMDNCQVRFLCGRVDKPYGTIDQADFEDAIKNLHSRIDVFGVLERFDEFMIDCRAKLGWKRVYYYRENEYKGDKALLEIDVETEKLIKHYTRFGNGLYAIALKEIEERIATNHGYYKSEKRRIQRWNRVYGLFKQTKRIFGLK